MYTYLTHHIACIIVFLPQHPGSLYGRMIYLNLQERCIEQNFFYSPFSWDAIMGVSRIQQLKLKINWIIFSWEFLKTVKGYATHKRIKGVMNIIIMMKRGIWKGMNFRSLCTFGNGCLAWMNISICILSYSINQLTSFGYVAHFLPCLLIAPSIKYVFSLSYKLNNNISLFHHAH